MRKHWRGIRYRHNLEGYSISACSEFLFFPLFPKLENNESLKQIICQKGKVPWKQETVIYFTDSIGNGKKKKNSLKDSFQNMSIIKKNIFLSLLE